MFCSAYGGYQNMPTNKQLRRIPKTLFNLFSATANRRKCLSKSTSLRRIAKGANFFLSTTANREIDLLFFRLQRIAKKVLNLFFLLRRIRKKDAPLFFRLLRQRRKMLRAQNRVLRCGQPASRRLLRKTAILTQMLHQRNSATAN